GGERSSGERGDERRREDPREPSRYEREGCRSNGRSDVQDELEAQARRVDVEAVERDERRRVRDRRGRDEARDREREDGADRGERDERGPSPRARRAPRQPEHEGEEEHRREREEVPLRKVADVARREDPDLDGEPERRPDRSADEG